MAMLVFLFMNPFPLHFPICWWHEARGTSMAMASSATSCRSSVLKNFAQVLWREGLTQTWCPIATLVVISRLTIGFVVGVLCAYVILYIIIYIYILYSVYIYIYIYICSQRGLHANLQLGAAHYLECSPTLNDFTLLEWVETTNHS